MSNTTSGHTILINTKGDTSGVAAVTKAVEETGTAATKAAGLYQDAAGRWRQANGTFATDAQKAAAGVAQIGKQSKEVDKVTDSLKRADKAADDFLSSIKAGVGIDLGGRIINSVAAIPAMLQQAVSDGIQFNITMNNAENGLANVLGKFMEIDKVSARREAARAMQQIIELEPKAAGGLEDLVQGLMATAAASQSAGMSVRENIDLVGRFANAVANANQPTSQLAQEMRAIITGNIGPDAQLAKTLEITSADIANAKEAGNLYGYLVEQLGDLGNAGDSAAVRMSSFDSAVKKALGELTRPAFNVFIEGVSDLTESINNGGDPAVQKLGQDIAELVRHGVNFTQWAIEHQAVLIAVGKAVGVVVAAWSAFQIAALIVGLNRKATAILANKVALDAETAALAKHTAAQQADNAARAAGATTFGRMRGALNSPVTGVVAGAAAVYGGWELRQGIRDTRIGLEMGGKSSLGDLSAAAEMRNQSFKELSEFAESIRNLKSEADRGALMADLAKRLNESVSAQKEAGFTEEGRTAQNQALSDHARALSQLMEVLKGKGDLLSPEQVQAAADQKAQEAKAAAERASNEEKDAKLLAERDKRAFDSEQDKIANQGISDASDLAKKGDAAGATKTLDELQKTYADWLAGLKEFEASQTGQALDDNIKQQESLQGYLDAIEEARVDLPKLIAEAEKKATEERIKALEEEKALADATGQKRLAELESLKLSEDDMARRRKQIEDDIAAKRLDIENQIGALQEESALQRDARLARYSAEEIQRENALRTATENKVGATKPLDLFSGTTRRRGAVTSDSFEQGSGVESGNFARPLTDFSTALGTRGSSGFGTEGSGFTPPSSVPPSAAMPGQPGSDGGQDGKEASENAGVPQSVDQIKKSLASVVKTVSDIAKAAEDARKAIEAQKAPEKLGTIGPTIAAADAKLQTQIDDINRRV